MSGSGRVELVALSADSKIFLCCMSSKRSQLWARGDGISHA